MATKAEKVELIFVLPVKNDGRVAFHEVHSDHPKGEVWVAGDAGSKALPKPVLVARTAAVSFALGNQRIREVVQHTPAAPKPYRRWKVQEMRDELELRHLLTEGTKNVLIARLKADDTQLAVENEPEVEEPEEPETE